MARCSTCEGVEYGRAVQHSWQRLGEGIHRCRLPFLDVTIGVVAGRSGVVLIDSGSTRDEGLQLAADVSALTESTVSHVVLTHQHFDHVLGTSAFPEVHLYAAPGVAEAMTTGTAQMAADAVAYGVNAADAAIAVAGLRRPGRTVDDAATIDLGDRHLDVLHIGRGHTRNDLVVVVDDGTSRVVFCGDLVEESADPNIDDDSDLTAWPDTLERLIDLGGATAVYVPGHGAVVDAEFVARQRDWLRDRL